MNNVSATSINQNDLLYEFATACGACRSQEDFVRIARGPTRQLLPSNGLIAALGRIDLEHLEILHLIPVDYPPAAFASIQRTSNLRDRSALVHWLKARKPIVLQLSENADVLSPFEQHEIRTHRLGRIAAHGVLDLAARSGSYFSFTGVSETLPADSLMRTLDLVIPHLHQALMSVPRSQRKEQGLSGPLSPTEWQLLRWVAAGRTNAEIALVRGRSAATVRNQLASIFRKMGARNRAEAVRKVSTSL